MDGVNIFFIAVVLAAVLESVLEYVFGIWWKPFPDEMRPKVLMGIGLVLGVAVCLVYGIDLLAAFGLQSSVFGQILSGALIGRGSDFLHQFLTKWSGT